ncbi:T9SS type A sorting domain-containing protein [candidate division KSB1 bacterium]|nr:T9SS type A sorting domain-containing protein [candidate division KSB1 bacterium]
MRNIIAISLLLIGSLLTSVSAQPADTQIESIADYEDWGWTSIVQQNDLITIATVPDIGAHIMQYDLGDHQSMYIDQNDFGKVYANTGGSPWSNGGGYGGYKTWPAPQDNWGWEPPAKLAWGIYESQIVVNTTDSTSLFVSSPVETDARTPDLRFERKSTIYKGSSRVRVDQTIINEGSTKATWSVWDVTQCLTPNNNDYWVYFPINPNSSNGSSGVRKDGASDAWVGEVAPGIYGVQFKPDNKKIFADSHKGWICYVDEGAGKAYAKTFQIWEDATYPDQNGRVQVWVNGSPRYLEVEVTSPLVALDANGGRYTFTEDWGAAKVSGPILVVNTVGAVARALDLDNVTGNLVGNYGVFYIGTVKVVAIEQGTGMPTELYQQSVTPLENLQLNVAVNIPENTHRVEVRIYDSEEILKGVLDFATPEELSSVKEIPVAQPQGIELSPNYPNPFNSHTTIAFRLDQKQAIRLAVYDIQGRQQALLASEVLDAGSHSLQWDASNLPGGVYFARIEGESFQKTVKMVYMP